MKTRLSELKFDGVEGLLSNFKKAPILGLSCIHLENMIH